MSVELGEVLSLAAARNKSIPELIKANGVLRERDPKFSALVTVLAVYYLRRGSVLEGHANLEKATRLIEDGNPVVEESDHQSDSDHAIKRVLLQRNGFTSFANRKLYLSGLKMLERREIKFFTASENVLLIPTPFDMQNVEDALKLKDLTEEQTQALSRLRRNYINLSTKAIRSAAAHLKEKPDHIIGLYPEATRSKTGVLGDAQPLTNMWYRFQEGTYILPVAVEGGNYFHPPNTFPTRRVNARVAVGEPVPVEQIIEKAKCVPESRRDQFFADYAFSFVVNLMDPKFVPASKRSYYRALASV